LISLQTNVAKVGYDSGAVAGPGAASLPRKNPTFRRSCAPANPRHAGEAYKNLANTTERKIALLCHTNHELGEA